MIVTDPIVAYSHMLSNDRGVNNYYVIALQTAFAVEGRYIKNGTVLSVPSER
jgi:hypothetical protein